MATPEPTADLAVRPQHGTAAGADAPTDSAAGPYPYLAAPQRPDEIGRLGAYRVLGPLGAGGMGAVFRAEDTHLKRQVALKVMLPQFAANPTARVRFLREARAQATVEHDHVVSIYQVGEDAGVPFLAMPLLKGQPLSDALKAAPLVPVPEAVRIAREVATGLAAAHDTGLVHRDVKPANIWLEGKALRVKLLDFGLARPAAPDGADAADPVTQTGVVVGTPAYMSPEQARGEPLDGRTDLFSLGCVLYQMLTGLRPFRAASTTGVLIAVATETPPRPAELNPAVPPALDALTMRLLAKAPGGRPPTAAAAAAELLGVETSLGLTGMIVVPAATATDHGDPFTDLDLTPISAPVAASAKRKKSPPWLLIGSLAAFAVVAVVAAQVVIKIKNKDGTETEVKVPKDATVTVTKDGKEVAKVGPDAGKKADPPAWTPPKPIPAGESPFDKLDANAIPKEERFDWQPKELVAVIGTHARRHWGHGQAVAVSDDGTKAATVGHEPNTSALPEVIIWDTATQKPIRRFHLRDASAERVQFAEKDSRLYLFGSPSIQLWDIAVDPPKPAAIPSPPKYVARFSGWLLEGGKTYCAQNNDGGWDVALFSLDGTGKADGERRKINNKLSFNLSVCAVAPSAGVIVYPSPENTLRRATVRNAKFVDEEELPVKLMPSDFPRGLTADGKELVVADEKGLGFWDISVKPPVERRRILQSLLSGTDRVTYSPCGRWLAMRNNAGTSLWRIDGAEPKQIARLDPHEAFLGGVGFSGDGNSVVVTNNEGLVRIWDLHGAEPKELSPFDPGTGFRTWSSHLTLTRFARASSELMLCRGDSDPENGRTRWQTWSFDGPTPHPTHPADRFLAADWRSAAHFAPAANGRWIYSQPQSGRGAQLWSFVDGKWGTTGEPFTETDPNGFVTGDGKTYLAFAGGDSGLDGWDVTGVPAKRWSVPHPAKYPVTREGGVYVNRVVASSTDGSRFAVSTWPRKGAATDVTIFRSTGTRAEHQSTINLPECQPDWYIAAMSPDGRFLAHSQSTLTAEPEVLDVSRKEPKNAGNLPTVLGNVHWLAYSPDGRHLAAAGSKGVAVFDAKTLQPVWTWDTSPGPVYWLDWAADGRHLVTHNANKTVYVLRLGQLSPAGAAGAGDDRSVAEWLLKRGGGVAIRVEGDDSAVIPRELPDKPFQLVAVFANGSNVLTGDDDLIRLKGLKHLEAVKFRGTAIRDDSLKHLEGLRTLRNVDLSYCTHLTTNCIDSLRKLRGLRSLVLVNTGCFGPPSNITRHLKDWPELETLELHEGADDEDFARLGQCRTLRHLFMNSCERVSEAGLLKLDPLPLSRFQSSNMTITEAVAAMLAKKPSLTALSFSGVAGDPVKVWKHLGRLSELQSLGTCHCRGMPLAVYQEIARLPKLTQWVTHFTDLSDEKLAALHGHRTLETLNADLSPLTDKSVPTLASMTRLKEVWLNGTQMTAAGVKKLQAARPDCQVHWDEPKK